MAGPTWIHITSEIACNSTASAITQSPAPTLEACQKRCEELQGCQSISYSDKASCARFSTPCTNTMFASSSSSWRVIRPALRATVTTKTDARRTTTAAPGTGAICALTLQPQACAHYAQ